MKQKIRFAPLSGAYMAISMMGFLISIVYIYNFSEMHGFPKEYIDSSKPWGIAFAIVFAAMFIASIGSMTRADPDSFVEVETKHKKKK